MPPGEVSGDALRLPEHDARRDVEFIGKHPDDGTISPAREPLAIRVGHERSSGELVGLAFGVGGLALEVEVFVAVQDDVSQLVEEREPQLIVALHEGADERGQRG